MWEYQPKADSENWSFAVVKASASEKSGQLSPRLANLNRKTSALLVRKRPLVDLLKMCAIMRKEVSYDEEEIQTTQFLGVSRRHVLKRASEDGVTDEVVCEELGISPRQLRRWRDQYRLLGDEAFPGQGKSRDEELTKLKRELAKVKQERDFLRDAGGFLRQGVEMRYRCIASTPQPILPVNMMCRLLEVSSSGYYVWRVRPESQRARSDRELTRVIRRLHADSDGVYGSRKITADPAGRRLPMWPAQGGPIDAKSRT